MYIIVFVTVAKKSEARQIALMLIKNKLAACVNIIDRVNSLFWWQGKVDRAGELLLIIKTKKSKFVKLAKLVKSLHSYTVPEIIALPIIMGNPEYLEWINDSFR